MSTGICKGLEVVICSSFCSSFCFFAGGFSLSSFEMDASSSEGVSLLARFLPFLSCTVEDDGFKIYVFSSASFEASSESSSQLTSMILIFKALACWTNKNKETKRLLEENNHASGVGK